MPRNPGLPHFRRIANELLLSLRENKNHRMPSENALARRHGVARQTARRALEELRSHGYITRFRGSGSYSRDQSAQRIYLFGYLLHSTGFSRFLQRLQQRLGSAGWQLRTIETGFLGENLKNPSEILEEIRGAEMVIWFAPSHPLALQAANRVRRHFPARLPLVLINDPLGLKLHGSHRFDLVHFDAADAIGRLLDWLESRGWSRPVLVTRSDVSLYYTAEMRRGLLAALAERGERDPEKFVTAWDVERPASLAQALRRIPHASSTCFLLEYNYRDAFLHLAQRDGLALKPEQVIAFGQRSGEVHFAGDLRDLADVCADLAASRKQRPARPNLHVELHLRFRSKPANEPARSLSPRPPTRSAAPPGRR